MPNTFYHFRRNGYELEGGIAMSLMCSMQVCKQTPGMCTHEKMMLGGLLLLIAGVGTYFLLT